VKWEVGGSVSRGVRVISMMGMYARGDVVVDVCMSVSVYVCACVCLCMCACMGIFNYCI
jgi:hypothetical protein